MGVAAKKKKKKKKHIKDLLLDPLCLAAGEMSSEIPEELRRALFHEPRRHISRPGTKAAAAHEVAEMGALPSTLSSPRSACEVSRFRSVLGYCIDAVSSDPPQ